MKTDNCIKRDPVPSGAIEPTTNAMIEFDGYYWWTNYPFGISYSGYWFNGQQWDPRLATVDSEGLHLKMQRSAIPIMPKPSAPPYESPGHWSSIEILLWGKIAGNPNVAGTAPKRDYPGYGTYLVAASCPLGFNELSNNCCFGAFSYQFQADSSQTNAHRELDMMECSRWNNQSDPTNAQFTLQPWASQSDNVHRITLQAGTEMTIVMDWPGEGVPVTYSVYYGIHDLATLPSSPDITWTTGSDQNQFIPDEGCQTIHLNLWRQPQNYTPSADQEVIIKKFQYKPI